MKIRSILRRGTVKTLVFLMMLLTSTLVFAAEDNQIGTDKDGNDIYLMSGVKEVVPGVYNMIVQYRFRIKELAHNAVPPIKGMREYKVYVDHADHSIIVDCNGLKRVTILDSRLYNNIGKEIELYKPDFSGRLQFKIYGEPVMIKHFCK